jgi:hypothetical protein
MRNRRDEDSVTLPFHRVPGVVVREPGTGQQPFTEKTHEEHEAEVIALLRSIAHDMRRQRRANFNTSNPVDEAAYGPALPSGTIDIQRDYDLPERIQAILYSIPVGATAATIQLGQRVIPLYSGAALATQLVNSLTNLGLIVGPDERRTLTVAGALTSGFFIALQGYAFEREGSR